MKKTFPASQLIINEDGSIFHLHIRPEHLADKVILVGDQGRVNMVASFFDEGSIECDIQSREFHTITGKYHGKRISCISTGIGTDNCDIVLNELDALANIDFATRTEKDEHRTLEIVRVGTCGGMDLNVMGGDVVIATEDEIRELNNIVEDVLDEDLAAALENADVVYDMMATSLDQTHNIIVTLEKVNPIQLATLNIAKNYEVVYSSMEQSFEDMGYKNIMHKVDTITVDGKELDALVITADVYGMNIYQTTFCIKCNGYLASVCVTSVGINTNAKLLDTFYWVD